MSVDQEINFESAYPKVGASGCNICDVYMRNLIFFSEYVQESNPP